MENLRPKSHKFFYPFFKKISLRKGKFQPVKSIAKHFLHNYYIESTKGVHTCQKTQNDCLYSSAVDYTHTRFLRR